MTHLEQSLYEHYMKVYKGQTLWRPFPTKYGRSHMSARNSKEIARMWLASRGLLS